MKLPRLVACLTMTLAAAPAAAQLEPLDTFPRQCAEAGKLRVTGIGEPDDDYARIAEIIGASPIRPRVARRISDTRKVLICRDDPVLPWTSRLEPRRERRGPELELLPLRTSWVANTGYPDDRNNGAVWAGKGLSGGIQGGLGVRWGPLSAAIEPAFLYQQNADFEIRDLLFQPDTTEPPVLVPRPGTSPFANPYYRGIDLPQRFGDGSYSTFDLGGSYLRLDLGAFAAGVAKENLWWGPGRRNALLMTNSAAGFPHVFAGTSRPVEIGIGRLDVEAVWGRVQESEYFDSIPGNGDRLLTALALTWEPRWIPGLFLGISRAFMYDDDGTLGFGDYVPFFGGLIDPGEITDTGEQIFDEENELFSVSMRWVLPESGFEVYAEWGRDDASADFEDLTEEPDHTQAYVLGLQKVLPAGRQRLVRVAAEIAHLQENRPPRIARSTGVFYTHSVVQQGYTHEGQMLGAGIGPGADSQYLAADLFDRWGSVGLYLERVRRDDQSEVALHAREEWPFEHDVQVGLGVRGAGLLGDFDLRWGLGYGYRYNRSFLEDQASWTLRLGLGWRAAGPIIE